jgi:hypothetical protein
VPPGRRRPGLIRVQSAGQAGNWWIAANLVRDVAALANMEMLPWDVWGAMLGWDEPIDDERLALFDRLSELTRDPDASFSELTAAYATDDRLRVPPTVYNAVLNRSEPVPGSDRGPLPPDI